MRRWAARTRPPGMRRYASHRDDHMMSLSSQYTSYVYTILAPAGQQLRGLVMSHK